MLFKIIYIYNYITIILLQNGKTKQTLLVFNKEIVENTK